MSCNAERKLKIVALCGCGLGACFLLKQTAEKAARELGIPIAVELGAIGERGAEDADAYLVPLGLDKAAASAKPVIAIRNVLSVPEMKAALANLPRGQTGGTP